MPSILDAIGNTPLVRLRRCVPANGAELWVKLEYANPSGSMKDRMALAMIEGAERDGLLEPGDTVVEYTGGSPGPALALVCNAKGCRPLIVMADCYSEERFQLLRALGAEVDVIPSVEGRPNVTARDIENMIARARELAARPRHYATDQFSNPYVAPAHRDGLGREIWKQTDRNRAQGLSRPRRISLWGREKTREGVAAWIPSSSKQRARRRSVRVRPGRRCCHSSSRTASRRRVSFA